jgi:hypothetical protein
MHATRLLFAVLACVTTLLPAGPVALAQNLPDADAREVQAYVLTEAGLARYVKATRGLSGIRIEDCDDETDVNSLAEAAAKIDAVPGAKAAVQSAGMTSREYVVFAFSLIQNGMAAYLLDTPGGRLPPGVSRSNVDFYRQHAGELEKLAAETEDESCEDGVND